MACERFAGAIRAHALGESLDATVAAHLAVCAGCQEDLVREERLIATIATAVATVSMVEPAPDFVPRVRAHVEQTRRWTAHRWFMPAAAAAVLAVAIVAGNPRQVPVSVSLAPDAAPATETHDTARGPQTATSRPPDVTIARTGTRQRRAARQVLAVTGPAAAAPEVLVPEDQRRALGRLVAAASAGRPEALSMLTAIRPTEFAATLEAPALVVPALRIEPVVVDALVIAESPIEK
jgi:hypothetical protein